MAKLFKNKFRIGSIRWEQWDYGFNAHYFITICTQYKVCFFGNVSDGKMQLSEIGQLAHNFWLEIPNHFPFVELGEFVIMPDHMHGIIIINKTQPPDDQTLPPPDDETSPPHDETSPPPDDGMSSPPDDETSPPDDGMSSPPDVATSNLDVATGAAKQKWKPQTLGVIINQYKRIVTIHARKIDKNFSWQSNYYDHVIRNQYSFHRISNYIVKNPSKWRTGNSNDRKSKM